MLIRSLRPVAAPLVVALLLGAAPLAKALDRWVVDESHFAVGFLVDHIGFARVLGMFLRAEGQFHYDPDTMTFGTGEFVIHADSVFTNHEERDRHLRGSDFLDVANHPRIVFRPRGIVAAGDGAGRLLGDLELLGLSREVALDFSVNKVGRYPFPLGGLFSRAMVLGVSLRGTIRRSEWGMTYGLSRGLVGDEIDLILEFEAQRR